MKNCEKKSSDSSSSLSCSIFVDKELKSILRIESNKDEDLSGGKTFIDKSDINHENLINHSIDKDQDDIQKCESMKSSKALKNNKNKAMGYKCLNMHGIKQNKPLVSDLSLGIVKQSETNIMTEKNNKDISMDSNQKDLDNPQTNLTEQAIPFRDNQPDNLDNKIVTPDTSTVNSSCAYIDENHFFDGKKVGKYVITKSLGSGSFSSVKQGMNIESGETVAIKIVKRDPDGLEVKEERVYREVLISSLLCHPHIVRLKNFYFNEGFFFLIFEFVDGSMLLDVILEEGPLPEKLARRYFRQILSALGYIHENSVVHRDLKIENILIDENGNIKIVDFGLSNFYDNRRFLETSCGSLYFAAPELLLGKKYLGPEIDIWSLGIILYVLLCGTVPFDDKNMQRLHQKIKEAKLIYTKTLSSDVKKLLEKMVCNDMTKRATLEDILEDKWVNKGYTNRIDIYAEKREPIDSIDEKLVYILNLIASRQFPTLSSDIRQYVKACKDKENYTKNLLYKKPAVSLYYLLKANFVSSNEYIDKGYQDVLDTNKEEIIDLKSEEMHNFVNFIFSRDKKNTFSQYFSGSIFNEKGDIQNDDESLREEFYSKDDLVEIESNSTLPRVKKSFIKGFIGGILLKNLTCQEKIRYTIQTLLKISKIEYQILDRHYLCKYGQKNGDCSFKLYLFFNVIIGSYFVSMKKISGDLLLFKEVRRLVSEYLEQSSTMSLAQAE